MLHVNICCIAKCPSCILSVNCPSVIAFGFHVRGLEQERASTIRCQLCSDASELELKSGGAHSFLPVKTLPLTFRFDRGYSNTHLECNGRAAATHSNAIKRVRDHGCMTTVFVDAAEQSLVFCE
jgi:hypothetical protein